MRRFAIFVMLGLISLVSAKPAFLSVPLTYATPLTPAATQVGTNRGPTLDRPKNSAAHSLDVERRTILTNEAGTSIGSREQESSRLVNEDAPLGVDGRVVDTPEVAAAKAAHVAAHVNEKINLANEAARSGSASETDDDVILTETSISSGKGVLNTGTSEVNEKIDLETVNAAARSLVDGSAVPLVLGNGVVATLVPVRLDGRPVDVPETAVARSDQNPTNDARSVNALAIAGPTFAYGKLIY